MTYRTGIQHCTISTQRIFLKILAKRNFFKHKIRMKFKIFIFGSNLTIPLPTSVTDPDPPSGANFYHWIRDGKKSKARIRDEHPGSYFGELSKQFFFKYLNSLMQIRIRDPDNSGSGIEKIRSGILDPG